LLRPTKGKGLFVGGVVVGFVLAVVTGPLESPSV
jgi:hypothetical protein